MDDGVAIVTGANTGIGLSLVKRLLGETNLTVCLVCRNKVKAHRAMKDLNYEFPDKKIGLLICDIASPQSVIEAAKQIKEMYTNISHIYFNAGVMSNPIIDWKYMGKTLFSRNCVQMLNTAHGLLKQTDRENHEGLCEMFSTNVFGHFIMLMELEEKIGMNSDGGVTQIIWTSSSNAKRSAFSIENIQHKNGLEPYSSSKYAVDLLSYQLNQELNHKGIYSHTACPGFVVTNLAYGILTEWIWFFIIPILILFRLVVPSLTLRPKIACYSLFWLATVNPVTLDPKTKFFTRTSIFGTPFLEQKTMDLEPDLAKKACHKVRNMTEYYKTHRRVQN